MKEERYSEGDRLTFTDLMGEEFPATFVRYIDACYCQIVVHVSDNIKETVALHEIKRRED